MNRLFRGRITIRLAAALLAVAVPLFQGYAWAGDPKSPTAALFGAGEAAARHDEAPATVPMDEIDASATGMLRLQDLDERFAEAIFGREAAAGGQKRD